MPVIKPFRAIRPNPVYAGQLVFTATGINSMFKADGPEPALLPLKNALESGARLRPETEEGQAAAYADILQKLQALIGEEKLLSEEGPGMYVYEIRHAGYRQTGIWALTDLHDYTSGKIKTHELTFADSVRRLKNYRENTGLEGSPVLLTYEPDVTVNRIIAYIRAKEKAVEAGNHETTHKLWKIEDKKILDQLTIAFAGIQKAYLADGHHRFASSALLADDQRARGRPAFDSIASLYIAADQLYIREYHRVYLPEKEINKDWLFEKMAGSFEIKESVRNKPVQPLQLHHIGMYIDQKWYELIAKPHTYAGSGLADALDPGILQQRLFAPVFSVFDPGTDKRLKYIGGTAAMQELLAFAAEHPLAIAFTLCPLTVQQLMAVADAGEILPPKSTWIDPKVPYGLLLYQHKLSG